MSFEPVTWWRLRCNGVTTNGQCTTIYQYFDLEAEETCDALLEKPVLADATRDCIEREGWTVTGPADVPILTCPDHVAAAEHMLAAQLDGLPFDLPPGQPA